VKKERAVGEPEGFLEVIAAAPERVAVSHHLTAHEVSCLLEDSQAKVVLADAEQMPAGEAGQIRVTPRTLFDYLKVPEKTAHAMRGWLFTSDRRTDMSLAAG
jgi:hypothetical protein